MEPALARLPEYADELACGWPPNSVRDVSAERLEAIGKDAAAFVA